MIAIRNIYEVPSWVRVLYAVFCAAVLVFLAAPILAIVPLSFSDDQYFSYTTGRFSTRWYEEFLFTGQWQLAAKNSIIVGIFATAISTLLGTMAALGLWRMGRRAKAAILTVVISPLAVPVVISGVAMFYAFSRLGLTNSLTGLVLAHTALGVPFVVITVSAMLGGTDENLIRAGLSLGETPLRVFFKVTLPLILPGVISGALFAFATSWDDVVAALFLAGAEQYTLPRQMWSGIREYINPTLLAVATALTLVSLVLMLLVDRLNERAARLRAPQHKE
jgi:putative spermidine/putrescine transport system permease protein